MQRDSRINRILIESISETLAQNYFYVKLTKFMLYDKVNSNAKFQLPI
jgi:hypothetical protein